MVTSSGPRDKASADHVRELLAGRVSDPDLVDRIFELLLELCPEIPRTQLEDARQAAREEFAGSDTYIPKRSPTAKQQKVEACLAMFNGRNATEVARRLEMSRAWVYRVLKQAGR